MELAFAITFSVLTAIVIGLTEAGKQLGLPKKYTPVLAVLLGVLFTIGLALFEITTQIVLTGVVIGLSACGLYDLGKKTILGK